MAKQKNKEEDKNVFDGLEEQSTAPIEPEEGAPVHEEEMAGDPDDQIQDLGEDDFSDTAPADRVKKVELDGKIVPIKEVRFTRPKTSDFKTGKKIDPIESDSKALYYRAKLVLLFDVSGLKDIEAKNVAEYYPNVKYFVNEGTIQRVPKMPRAGTSVVAQLFALYAKTVGKEIDEISDREFIKALPLYNAKLKVAKGNYKGSAWFRNDIAELIKR